MVETGFALRSSRLETEVPSVPILSVVDSALLAFEIDEVVVSVLALEIEARGEFDSACDRELLEDATVSKLRLSRLGRPALLSEGTMLITLTP